MLYRKQSYYRMPIDNPKAALTFNCVHNMIMDTCRDEAEWVQAHGWSNNTRPCFFGLCCLYGAAAQLNELRLEGLSTEDIWTLRNSLLSFSNRWRLGGECFSYTRDVNMNVLTAQIENFLSHLNSMKSMSNTPSQISAT
jgi:hypothetical protein